MEERDGGLALGREGDGRAHLQRHRARQLRQARPEAFDDLANQDRRCVDAGFGIGGEGAAGRPGGPVHIGARAQADLRESLLRRRVDDSQGRGVTGSTQAPSM